MWAKGRRAPCRSEHLLALDVASGFPIDVSYRPDIIAAAAAEEEGAHARHTAEGGYTEATGAGRGGREVRGKGAGGTRGAEGKGAPVAADIVLKVTSEPSLVSLMGG